MREPRRPASVSLAGRLLAWYAVVFVVLIALFGVVVGLGVRQVLLDQLTGGLASKARILDLELPEGVSLQDRVAAAASAADARITVIATNGTVLADSDEDPTVMENHATRPEVLEALAGRVGVDRRTSATLDEARLYVAIPPGSAERIIRLSVTEVQLRSDLAAIVGTIVLAALLAGILGVAVVAVVARRTAVPIRELTEVATSVADGRLELRPDRSAVSELDRLGTAVGRMASELGSRITETEEERRTLELVLGALPQGVLLVERDDRLGYANPVAGLLLGPVPDRLDRVAPLALQRLVREARTSGESVVDTVEHGSPTRALQTVATPFEDGSGRVLLVVSDVTERRRVEAMRRDFVADASHELKTPVAAIQAAAETLRMALDRDPAHARRFADQVASSARHLARIVADLLDLSRLESSEPATERVRLDRVASEEAERIAGRARTAGVEVRTRCDRVQVAGSPSDLGLAVRNLLDNALRYTNEGGSVTLTVTSADGTAVVEVADTGAGIPTRELPRVFERFYRVDVARSRATGGTGLGLAIVKHVAERHGGTVSVTSELGSGSTFRIELPADRGDPAPSVPPTEGTRR